VNLLQHVHHHREAIFDLAAHHGVRRVRLFGSVARGDPHAASDIDVLVDIEPGRSLLDQIAFEQGLQEILGRRVDVVVEGGISPYLERRILSEAIPL
jgi:predicted nucleotidyltransferase